MRHFQLMSQLKTHSLKLKFDLNSWYNLQQEWLEVLDAICQKNPDNNSQELTALLEAEARWQAEQDYYHLQYDQGDRLT